MSESNRSWLSSPTNCVDGTHLYSIGEAFVTRKDAEISGVPTRRLADVFQLGESEDDQQLKTFFMPFLQFEGRKSFLPEDLDDTEEQPLHQLAEHCEDPIARARIFEVLLARFPTRRRDYQPKIVAARLSSLAYLRDWPTLVKNIARASVLASQATNDAQLGETLKGWEQVGSHVLASEYWWAFCRVAVAFAEIILKNRWARPLIDGSRIARWNISTQWFAQRSSALHHFQRQAVLEHVGDWCGLIGDLSGRIQYHRQQIEDILAEAEERKGLLATYDLSRALKLAGERGGPFKDLALRAKQAFPAAMKQGETEFKSHTISMRVPEPIISFVNEALDRTPNVQITLQSFAAFPLLMELPSKSIEASAKKSLQQSIAWRIMPSVTHRDGKIVSISSTEEERMREQIALVSRIHTNQNEVLAGHILAKIFENIIPTDLYEAVCRCPGLNPKRLPFLHKASERFAAQDWISAGVITSVMYEAVLRDFVRSAGYPARQVEPDGVHADQTLGDMLRATEVCQILGEQHVAMVMHVLCDPKHGINLRNEVSHGAVQVGALTPERIFLVWLFMIRLSLLREAEESESSSISIAESQE